MIVLSINQNRTKDPNADAQLVPYRVARGLDKYAEALEDRAGVKCPHVQVHIIGRRLKGRYMANLTTGVYLRDLNKGPAGV